MQFKTRHIRIRFEPPLYNFLLKYSAQRGMNISDTVRNICTMLYMLYEINSNKKTLKSIFADSKRREKMIAFLDKI